MPRIAAPLLLSALTLFAAPSLFKPAQAVVQNPAQKTPQAPTEAPTAEPPKTQTKVPAKTPTKASAKTPANLPVKTTALAPPPPANPGEDWCAAIGKRLGSVPPPVCRKLGLQPAGLVTVGGHALMSRDIAPPTRKIAQAGSKPPTRTRRILLIGGIHGDELTSASIVFRWLQWLDDANTEARQYHWRVIPVANPDGLLSNPPQRMNAHGVDLNRNFPTEDWNSDAKTYWANKTGSDPRRFPGQSAMSETETRWLHDQIESFQPDVVVSVHAPFGILDFDGPAHQPKRFGHLNLNRMGVYPGSLGNYGGLGKSLPVITIELPNANNMPPPNEQREIWEDMLTWLRRNIASKTAS
jgi:murein peptide amidase A